MSLINDALKRAKQSQQQEPLSTGAPPLPPVEPESSGGLGWFVPILVILLIIIAGVLVTLALLKQKPATAQAVAPVTNIVQVAAAPPVAPKTNVVVATPPPLPTAPELKLQGILLSGSSPQAIVNGQTVNIGDTVDGFRVKMISQDNVSLVAPDGSEKTLALTE